MILLLKILRLRFDLQKKLAICGRKLKFLSGLVSDVSTLQTCNGLLKRHAQLDKFADVFSAEQGVMTEWIIIASDFIRGESSSSEIAAFWSRFRKQLLRFKLN